MGPPAAGDLARRGPRPALCAPARRWGLPAPSMRPSLHGPPAAGDLPRRAPKAPRPLCAPPAAGASPDGPPRRPGLRWYLAPTCPQGAPPSVRPPAAGGQKNWRYLQRPSYEAFTAPRASDPGLSPVPGRCRGAGACVVTAAGAAHFRSHNKPARATCRKEARGSMPRARRPPQGAWPHHHHRRHPPPPPTLPRRALPRWVSLGGSSGSVGRAVTPLRRPCRRPQWRRPRPLRRSRSRGCPGWRSSWQRGGTPGRARRCG